MMSLLEKANYYLRHRNYKDALVMYQKLLVDNPEIEKIINYNITLAKSKLKENQTNIVEDYTKPDKFLVSQVAFGEISEDKSIYLSDTIWGNSLVKKGAQSDIVVVLYSKTIKKGLITARLFVKRAKYPIEVCIVIGDEKDRAVKITKVVSQLEMKYVVVTDEYAFPCRDWLEFAYLAYIKHHETIYASTGLAEVEEGNYFFTTADKVKNSLLQKSLEIRIVPKFLIMNFSSVSGVQEKPINSSIHLIDISELKISQKQFKKSICVIMPCIDYDLGLKTASLLQDKAGEDADFVVVKDTKYQGFIKTLNQTALCSRAKYIVYLAEDAVPGENWLKVAFETLEKTKKGLLAFNCGKWHGRIASFGMVNREWVYSIYGNSILFDGYKSHRADNELTVIARVTDNFIYSVESIVFENDINKDFRQHESHAHNFTFDDKELFISRYLQGFNLNLKKSKLDKLYNEYLDISNIKKQKILFK